MMTMMIIMMMMFIIMLCIKPIEKFDPEIDRIDTLEYLKRLMILYDKDGACHCRQADFVALYMLYNVDSDDAVITAFRLKDT